MALTEQNRLTFAVSFTDNERSWDARGTEPGAPSFVKGGRGDFGRVAQLGEHRPYKPGVTGSSPVPPI